MLYVLEDPSSRVAVLRLADRGRIWGESGDQSRVRHLRQHEDVHGVSLADAHVVGTSGACDWADNPAYVWRESDGPDPDDAVIWTGHEERAAVVLVGRKAERGVTAWSSKPTDWLDRLLRADVGLFPLGYECTLETVRDRDGHIARPRYPSDDPKAFQRITEWTRIGAVALKLSVEDARIGREPRRSDIQHLRLRQSSASTDSRAPLREPQRKCL